MSGTALAVRTIPRARITTVDAAGSAATIRLEKLTREPKRVARRFAYTTPRPSAVRVAARPRLKTTISSRPRATSSCVIAASRTTSAVGQGMMPGGDPHAGQALPGRLRYVVMVVLSAVGVSGLAVIVRVLVVPMRVRRGVRVRPGGGDQTAAGEPLPPPAQAGAHHAQADRDDQEPGGEVEPRIEVLGQDVLGEEQGHEAEGEHADRVRHGHDRTQGDRVLGGAARADQIGGHHRLAVTGGDARAAHPRRRRRAGARRTARRRWRRPRRPW